MLSVIINAVLFQIGWFACVLGAANNQPWLGAVTVLAILGFHLTQALRPIQEVRLIALAVLIGFAWDSMLVSGGILSYDSGLFHQSLAPHWIIAMWALFAGTLNVSLNWLKDRYLLAAVFGLVGGPLAFFAGHKLGAVSFSDTFTAMLILGIGWGLIMPLLVWLAQHNNGFNHNNRKIEVCDA